MSRNIFWMVEMDLGSCENVYGQLPCTADGDPGFECYNTYQTCQDRENYVATTKTITLTSNTMRSAGIVGYPCLSDFPTISPTQIKRGSGLAIFSSVRIPAMDFPVSDINLDPYINNRSENADGTFWGRLKARYPYYQKKPLRLKYGYLDDLGAITWTSERSYQIEKIDGPNADGQVQIEARDILAALDDDAIQLPEPSFATLTFDVDPLDTKLSVTVDDIATAFPAPGRVRINEELIDYASIDIPANELTNCTRGVGGTTADEHEADDSVQLAKVYDNDNVVDILFEMLTTAGIPKSLIPYDEGQDVPTGTPDEWDIEKANYLAGHLIDNTLSEPAPLIKHMRTLLEQTHINLWYEERLGKVRLSATNTRLAELTARPLNENANLIADSVGVTEDRKGIITQSWIYFDKNNVLEGGDPKDYNSLFIDINTELEDPNAWGEKRIVTTLADWLDNAGNIAITTNSRRLQENVNPRYQIKFALDAKDSDLYTGEFVTLETYKFQDKDGSPLRLSSQISSAKETIPGTRIEFTAEVVNYDALEDPNRRYGYIVNVANEGVDYNDADEISQGQWGWIAAADGFIDGNNPYRIQ